MIYSTKNVVEVSLCEYASTTKKALEEVCPTSNRDFPLHIPIRKTGENHLQLETWSGSTLQWLRKESKIFHHQWTGQHRVVDKLSESDHRISKIFHTNGLDHIG